jgi:hypothetical protein
MDLRKGRTGPSKFIFSGDTLITITFFYLKAGTTKIEIGSSGSWGFILYTDGSGAWFWWWSSMNDWGSGATVSITIKNTGTTVINNWTLKFAFPGNQQITNSWCAKFTQSGANVTITNESWNSSIPANGFVNLGFNIVYTGANEKPTSFTLN